MKSDPLAVVPPVHSCGLTAVNHSIHDAYYCILCNEWMEPVCEDPDCPYCKDRPARPVVQFTIPLADVLTTVEVD